MTITVYIVVEPWDYMTANVEVFRTLKEAVRFVSGLEKEKKGDHVTIRKTFIHV